jgi:hypothetical protein
LFRIDCAGSFEERYEVLNIKLAILEHEIVKFDSVLDRIQRHFPSDVRIWDYIANTRDALFRLQQSLHGLDVIDFTSAFEKPWWIEFAEDGATAGKEVA